MDGAIFNVSTIPDCVDGHVNNTPLYIKIAAAVTSLLSMCGALLIISTYVCFKNIRTRARELLVHISVMDFIVSCANFIGIAVDFNNLLKPLFYLNPESISPHLHIINGFCIAQAFFSMFGGLGSILWTTALAVFFYMKVMFPNENNARYAVYTSYIVCYGGTLLITLWFTTTGKLGHTAVGGSGWCSLIIDKPGTGTDHFTLFFGATLWLYITVIFLPVLCISLLVYLKLQVSAVVV